MAMSKIWLSPIFENTILPAENAGNIEEKPDFGIFSRFHHLIFSTIMHIRNVQNMAESDFWDKFFRPKIPEIYRKSPDDNQIREIRKN